jgi:peptidyl-prolyl cis-trans isomerase C
MKRIALAILTFALAGAVLPFAAAADDKPAATVAAPDKVVATIDGKPITEGDLAVAEGEIGQDMGTMPGAQKRTSLLEFLIDNQLFAEAAEGDKLDQGADFQTHLAYLKRRALRELYFDKVIKTSVTEAEARKIYDEQVKLLKPAEEVSARHILVDTEAEAKALKEKIDKGADFAQLAKENSKDPGSKDDGGNLGYFGHGQMVPQFEEVVFKLKKGEVSDPVKTQFGWHVIKLDEKRAKVFPPLEQVREQVSRYVAQKAQSDLIVQLRQGAKIERTEPPADAKPADAKPAEAKPEEKKPAEKKK